MNRMERLPFAKPLRIVAPDLLRSYCRFHPMCEVDGCRRRPTPEPHHLVPRSRGRSDLHENLLRLCPSHHRAWHLLGGRAWWRRYGDRLLGDARRKVQRALGLPEGG
jgi:5-methylcytosine-specific restriction endonuclease McrA